MAKGKKKDNLTIEEKLEQALVPRDKWPYEVPENWCWVRLETGFNVTSSKRIHKSDWKKVGIPFYRTRELVKLSEYNEVDNELFIDEELYEKLIEEYGKPEINDLLVSGVGTIGVPYIVSDNRRFYFKDGNVIWLKNKGLFNAKYIFYLYKSTFLKNQIYSMSAGTTVDTYTIVNANNTIIPLPPLSEQQRIVDRIESLFSKLDEAKEKAQEAIDSFEERKAAILYKAFSGELTKKWREENGVRIDSWKKYTLQQVCSMKITDGTHKTPTYCDKDEGIPFISAKDVTSEKINWTNIKYITKELHEELYSRLAPQIDDILLAKNGTTGVAAIVDIDTIFDIYVTLAVLRPETNIIYPQYLLNVINSPICKNQFDDHLTGIGVPNLHLRDIKEVLIPVPTLEEQIEIVNIVDRILNKESQNRINVKTVIECIDTIKKSILTKAFRAELGTNDFKEERAMDLLVQI